MPRFVFLVLILFVASFSLFAQEFRISKPLIEGSAVEITNLSGRVSVAVQTATAESSEDKHESSITIVALSEKGVREEEVHLTMGEKNTIEIAPANANKTINLTVLVPVRSRLSIETSAGAVDVSGNFESIDVKTDTGTVSTDIPDDAISYDFLWTRSRPRF